MMMALLLLYIIVLYSRIPEDKKFGIPIGEDGRWGSHQSGFEFLEKYRKDL